MLELTATEGSVALGRVGGPVLRQAHLVVGGRDDVKAGTEHLFARVRSWVVVVGAGALPKAPPVVDHRSCSVSFRCRAASLQLPRLVVVAVARVGKAGLAATAWRKALVFSLRAKVHQTVAGSSATIVICS